MKALVTGASGFIGSTLVDLLGQQGFDVYAMMRKTSKDTHLRGLRYTRVEGDLGNQASLDRAVRGMDVVFHLAGAISARNRAEFFEHNARGCERLADAIANHAPTVKRVVYVSSLAAGGPAPTADGRDETTPDAPVSAYGESKRAGEAAFLRHKDRYEVVIIRPPIVYGPKDSATFILISTVNKRILPRIPGRAEDGEKHHSIIHAEDLARGILAAGTAPSSAIESGEVFYLTSGERITLSTLMKEIATHLGVRTIALTIPFLALVPVAAAMTWLGRLLNRSFVLSLDKLNEIRPDYWVCSGEKACRKLGFAPKYTLPAGMKHTIDWYRENGWLR